METQSVTTCPIRETKKNIGSYVSGIMQETYFRMKDEYAAELGSTTQK